MGYNSYKDIGCHSIRKGATKWLSGQPGGPSAMAICIRGGWSLGGVKDVYMTYEAEGDAFCGRMLALLPLLQSDFAASPPKFQGVPAQLLQAVVAKVYPTLVEYTEFSNVARQPLARLAKAKDFVLSWPASHVVRQQNPLFSDVALLEQLSEAAIIMYHLRFVQSQPLSTAAWRAAAVRFPQQRLCRCTVPTPFSKRVVRVYYFLLLVEHEEGS